jgi:hypothetical protein
MKVRQGSWRNLVVVSNRASEADLGKTATEKLREIHVRHDEFAYFFNAISSKMSYLYLLELEDDECWVVGRPERWYSVGAVAISRIKQFQRSLGKEKVVPFS